MRFISALAAISTLLGGVIDAQVVDVCAVGPVTGTPAATVISSTMGCGGVCGVVTSMPTVTTVYQTITLISSVTVTQGGATTCLTLTTTTVQTLLQTLTLVTTLPASSILGQLTGCTANSCFNQVAAATGKATDCAKFVVTATVANTTSTVFATTTFLGALTSTTTVANNATINSNNTITSVLTFTVPSPVATTTTVLTSLVPGPPVLNPKAKRFQARTPWGRRQVAGNGVIPAYASNCGTPQQFASACSCAAGIQPLTTTITVQTATTTILASVTLAPNNTVTATLSGTVTNFFNTTTATSTTTTSPQTLTSTQTVVIATSATPAPTCATFQVQAVGGSNNGFLGQSVAVNDPTNDYVIVFTTDPTQASTFFINPLTQVVRDVATGFLANGDTSAGSTLSSVFLTDPTLLANVQDAALLQCAAVPGGQLTCFDNNGDTFYTNSGFGGLLIGTAGQGGQNGYDAVTLNVLNYAVVPCT